MATNSSILAWRIPWTEEPGGLQSMGCPTKSWTWLSNQHSVLCSHIFLLVHLFIKKLSRTYCGPGLVPGTGDLRDRILPTWSFCVVGETPHLTLDKYLGSYGGADATQKSGLLFVLICQSPLCPWNISNHFVHLHINFLLCELDICQDRPVWKSYILKQLLRICYFW